MANRFVAQTPVAVSGAPRSVTTADVNGDGRLDILTTNYRDGTVSVRLGDGNGGFSGTTDVAVGSNPWSAITADVNGDGHLDVLVANSGINSGSGSRNTVSVRLGDGRGGFSGSSDIAVGNNPTEVITADVNGDGRLDLLAANSRDGTVSVRLGDGAGGFSGSADVSVGGTPYSVEMADVNGDGRLDILAANRGSDTVSVRLGDGTGGFSGTTNVSVGFRPQSVTVADVNGDGKLDLLTANLSGSTVSVRLGDGRGGFSGSTDVAVGSQPTEVTAADVNGDGKLDILAANGSSDTVSVRLGDGRGGFSGGADLAVGLDPGSVTAADVNSDGRLDILAANSDSNTVSVLLNTNVTSATGITATSSSGATVGAGGTVVLTLATETPVTVSTSGGTPYLTLSNGAQAAYSGTDGLGRPQFTYTAASGQDTNNLTVTGLVANGGTISDPGQTSFGGSTDVAVGSYPSSVTTADINGDGNLDILAANYFDDNVSVRLGDGAGGFTGSTDVAVGTGPTSVALADVNGDGRLDLLAANYGSRTVSVRLGDGAGGFTGSTDVAAGSGPISLKAADVNGDGRFDLLAANSLDGTVSVRFGDGTGGFSGSTDVRVGSSPLEVVVADVNGDGDLDLLTANNGSDSVSLRLGDGTGGFTGSADISVGSSPISLAVADVNDDGKLDLLAANYFNNSVLVRLGDGAGGFTGATGVAVGNNPHSVAMADVNGDGKLDLIAANYGSGTVSVRLGDGSGGFAGGIDVAVGSRPYSVATADVNGDGKLDLLTANYGADSVSVVLNTSRSSAEFDFASVGTASGAATGIAVDATAPAFGSATVNGTTLALTYGEALDATHLPPVGAFTVLVAGQSVAVDSVAVSGSILTLTLASPVATGSSVTVSYGDPTPGNDTNAIQDAAGNDAASLGTTNVTNATPDTTAPTVAALTAVTANGAYKASDTVEVAVRFSEVVIVDTSGGTPRLTLETGATDRDAIYVSGSGTDTLTFRYAVQAGDTAADLDAAGTGALAPSGATIRDAAGNDAVLTLPAPGGAGSLGAGAAIAIDTIAPATPAIASPALTSDERPVLAGTAEAGTTVTLAIGGATYTMVATGGTWSVDLGVASPASGSLALDANGANPVTVTATDAAGNVSGGATQTLVLDTTAPSLAITSDKPTLIAGQSATITFTFSEAPIDFTAGDIDVSGGTLGPLTGSGVTRTALFTPTADTNNGIASITVAAGSYADAAGNNGGAANTPSLSFDTRPPATPTITSGALTNDATPVLSGTAEAGGTVTLSIGGATYTTVATGGAWSIDLGTATPASGTLTLDPNGNNALTVAVGDAAGNAATVPATQTLVIDTTPPPAPTLTLQMDTGGSATDGITSNGVVEIGGRDTGAIVQVSPNGGVFWYTALGPGLDLRSDGDKVVLARQVDAAGNVSSTTRLEFILDTSAPAPVSVSLPDAPLRIGDMASATITVAADADTYTLGPGSTIAGYALENIFKVSDTTYTATFTVLEGVDVAAGADLPVNLILVDRAGNANPAFTTAISQANDAIDATRPAFQSGIVAGRTLTLTFSEALSSTTAGSSFYTVLANGVPITVDNVTVSGSTVILTLVSAVASGATVTVAYADPTPGNDPNTVQDTAGNDAASLAATAVTNTTPGLPQPPVTPPTANIPTNGPDVLIGTTGSDFIDALGGNDTITGLSGNDTLFGGAGADQITATPGSGQVAFLYGGTGPNNPDDGADTITVSGWGAAAVWGNGGDDIIRYTADGAATVYAGAGADTVDVANNADNLVIGGGGAGGDVLTVRCDGANTVYGGSSGIDPDDGADRILVVGNGANTLFGNGGDDRIEIQGSGANLVYAGLGADEVVITGSGANTVYGGTGAGDAITIRGDGDNVVYGGSFNGDAADGVDVIRIEGNGANTVFANGGDDVVVLTGTGANTVYGGYGNDTILGGAGSDRIVAGQGANVLGGGAGADRFVVGAGEVDFITDFRQAEGDRIETGGQHYTVTSTNGGDAAITLANGSFIVLQGVAPGSVTTDYFV